MDKIWIRGIEPSRSQHLVLLLVLANEIKPQENNGHCHARVAGEVDTPSNMVSGLIRVKEDLGA